MYILQAEITRNVLFLNCSKPIEGNNIQTKWEYIYILLPVTLLFVTSTLSVQ